MFKSHPKRKIAIIVVIVIAALLVAGRLYLPFWAKDYVNTHIALLEGYRGGIQDIDLNLWRGAYKIHALEIRKQENRLAVPFAAARTVDLFVERKALPDGR